MSDDLDIDFGFRQSSVGVPAKPKPGKLAAAEVVAWCGLLAALRHDPHLFAGRSTCIGLVLPPDHPFEPYQIATGGLGDWLESRRRGYPCEALVPLVCFVGGRALGEGSTRPRKPGEVANIIRTCKVVLGFAGARTSSAPSSGPWRIAS